MVELLNIFTLNNEDGLSQILIFDFSIIFELFSLIIHFLGGKKMFTVSHVSNPSKSCIKLFRHRERRKLENSLISLHLELRLDLWENDFCPLRSLDYYLVIVGIYYDEGFEGVTIADNLYQNQTLWLMDNFHGWNRKLIIDELIGWLSFLRPGGAKRWNRGHATHFEVLPLYLMSKIRILTYLKSCKTRVTGGFHIHWCFSFSQQPYGAQKVIGLSLLYLWWTWDETLRN